MTSYKPVLVYTKYPTFAAYLDKSEPNLHQLLYVMHVHLPASSQAISMEGWPLQLHHTLPLASHRSPCGEWSFLPQAASNLYLARGSASCWPCNHVPASLPHPYLPLSIPLSLLLYCSGCAGQRSTRSRGTDPRLWSEQRSAAQSCSHAAMQPCSHAVMHAVRSHQVRTARPGTCHRALLHPHCCC